MNRMFGSAFALISTIFRTSSSVSSNVPPPMAANLPIFRS